MTRLKRNGHVLYVDLSAKAEQLLLDSEIAVSDGIGWIYLVPSPVKVAMQKWLSTKHGRKNLHYRVLAILIYAGVRERLAEVAQIVIDQDYTGAQPQATIKNLLLPLLRREHSIVSAEFIRFGQIKGSRADRLAKQVYDKHRLPDRVLSWSEIEKIIEE